MNIAIKSVLPALSAAPSHEMEDFPAWPINRFARDVEHRHRKLAEELIYADFYVKAADLRLTATVANVVSRPLLKAITESWDSFAATHALYFDRMAQADQRKLADELELVGDFYPSEDLVSIWVSSLKALGAEAGRAVVVSSDRQMAQEFSQVLMAMFGMIGQQLRYQERPSLSITSDRRFLPGYQIQICDAFLIVPDQASLFLDLLRTELHASILRGAHVDGAWGRVVSLSSGNLVFELNAAEFVEDSDFEESEDAE